MFKVPAESVEEYFRFDPEREHSLRELDALIRGDAPALSRWFVPGTPPGQPGMTMTLIGYGQYEYTVKSSPIPVTWPVIGIALQKSYLSFYSNVYADGQNFIAGYAGKLGPARVRTKGVVTFAHSPPRLLTSLLVWSLAGSSHAETQPRGGHRSPRSAMPHVELLTQLA